MFRVVPQDAGPASQRFQRPVGAAATGERVIYDERSGPIDGAGSRRLYRAPDRRLEAAGKRVTAGDGC